MSNNVVLLGRTGCVLPPFHARFPWIGPDLQTVRNFLHFNPPDLACYASRRLQEEPGNRSDTTIELVVGDILDLSVENLASLWPEQGRTPRLFEMVCCGGVLHHLVDPPAGLAALRSVLKTGGVLQLATYR